MRQVDVSAIAQERFDVCIVGAGPVGLSLAVELGRLGRTVLVLESGGARRHGVPFAPTVIVNPAAHAPLELATARGIGGTSALWGGRCLPLDGVDFSARPGHPGEGWPITEQDVQPHYDRAAEYLGCGPATFTDDAGDRAAPLRTDAVDISGLERWCADPFTPRNLKGRPGTEKVTIAVNAHVSGLDVSNADGRIEAVRLARPAGSRFANTGTFVLACGGLETVRVLLETRATGSPGLFGGDAGPLGRFYMGHVSGSVATLALDRQSDAALFDYRAQDRSVCRRRFTFTAEGLSAMRLPNISFYPANPKLGDVSHRNGLLSALFLLLSAPVVGRRLISDAIRLSQLGETPAYGRHFLNVAMDLPAALWGLQSLARQRFVEGRRKPFFFLKSRDGRYPLHYHAEHQPNADSRVWLTRADDAGGRKLSIDLRFGDADAEGIERAHRSLDRGLRRAGFGRLEFDPDPARIRQSILAQARDGFHQIGVTRMGSDQADGVVNRDCRVFGLSNLFLAGSGVFRTSGQANPTFFAVALAIRLAGHLAKEPVR